MEVSTNAAPLDDPVHVFWTGGWDSTFRVLDLALRQGRMVQPHYVRRAARESHPHEMAAMRAIHASVTHRFGEAVAGRIAPPRVVDFDSLTITPELRRWHTNLRKLYDLAPQYKFLHAHATSAGIDGIEVVVMKSDKLADFLRPHLQDGESGRLLVAQPKPPALALMRPFRFPALDIAKLEVISRAEAAGFLPEMMLTHFCFHPTLIGTPCGRCFPCVQTVAQGMGWRVPHDRWLPRDTGRA